MYRIAPLNKHTPNVISSFGWQPLPLTHGMTPITRSCKPSYVQGAFTCAFTILQLWSININYCVWNRCLGNIKSREESKEPNTDAEDSRDMNHMSTWSVSSGSSNKSGEEDFENEAFKAFLKFLNVSGPGIHAGNAVDESPW